MILTKKGTIFMDIRKTGNKKQLLSAYELYLSDGSAQGKKCILVNNGTLEVMFNASNALDIAWVKFNGVNLSYLSSNGLNSNEGPFKERFDGGFLYTCGLNNVSSCEKGLATHGSMHARKAENVYYTVDDDKITVCGTVVNSALRGPNLIFTRKYQVYSDKIIVSDNVFNDSYVDAEFALIYHTNFGYPFLDTCLQVNFDAEESIPANSYCIDKVADCKKIHEPLDYGNEELYYHVLKNNHVEMTNKKVAIKCTMDFDSQNFPYMVQWKNLYAGNYVLGIEPSTTRFDEYKKIKLSAQENRNLSMTVKFEKA